jgi:hypothetical protein
LTDLLLYDSRPTWVDWAREQLAMADPPSDAEPNGDSAPSAGATLGARSPVPAPSVPGTAEAISPGPVIVPRPPTYNPNDASEQPR